MRAQGYGRILLTTSDRALYPEYAQLGLAAYAAAKTATLGIANILLREGAAHGILVNTISPVAKTRMWGVEGEPDELRPDAGCTRRGVPRAGGLPRGRVGVACEQWSIPRAQGMRGDECDLSA